MCDDLTGSIEIHRMEIARSLNGLLDSLANLMEDESMCPAMKAALYTSMNPKEYLTGVMQATNALEGEGAKFVQARDLEVAVARLGRAMVKNKAAIFEQNPPIFQELEKLIEAVLEDLKDSKEEEDSFANRMRREFGV